MSELHAHRARSRMGGDPHQFPLLLPEFLVGALAVGDSGAKNEPGDRKHEHQNLELIKILGVDSNVRSRQEKCGLGGEERNRHALIAGSHAYPDDRQEQQIEQMIGVGALARRG